MKSGFPVPPSRTVIPAPRAINRTVPGGPDCASKTHPRANRSRIVDAPTIHLCVEPIRFNIYLYLLLFLLPRLVKGREDGAVGVHIRYRHIRHLKVDRALGDAN